MYELTIIGGGPAGVAAGVYASRKQLRTLFITKEWGGQSIVSTDIQNWIGTPSISGDKLATDLRGHLETYAGEYVDIKSGSLVTKIEKAEEGFTIHTTSGETISTKAILVASGSERRKLDAINADIFEHKGLTYCASCDGPMFDGQDVVVVGGGNAAFETAAQLLAYAKSVTLLQRGDGGFADMPGRDKVRFPDAERNNVFHPQHQVKERANARGGKLLNFSGNLDHKYFLNCLGYPDIRESGTRISEDPGIRDIIMSRIP